MLPDMSILGASVLLSYCFFSLSATLSVPGLQQLLSGNATIVNNTLQAPRWSNFAAPTPGIVVNVATEHDVLATVQYCIMRDIPFLAQNGGNGWATTFDLTQNGLLINLAGIRKISFNAARTEITLQGGALVSNVVAAGYANSALITTGTCNCIGTLGAILGGGVGNLMGLYGLGVDNIISLKVVLPTGVAAIITPQDADLWWAFRGAGPNFGIVTSAVMKSYPVNNTGLNAWLGPLIFTEDKLEALIGEMDALFLKPEMSMSLNFVTSGAPNYTALILLDVFYYGMEAAGKAAFSSLYAVGIAADETSVQPYDEWNAGSDIACIKGGFKPDFGAGLAHLVPATWRAVFNDYKTFVQTPGAGNSAILLDAYSMVKAKSIPDSSSSYPFRSTVKFNAVASTAYANSSLNSTALAFGSKLRNIWRSTSGLSSNSTYINNAFGDETLATVYGNNVDRLRSLKQFVDPQRRFDQWFPLT